MKSYLPNAKLLQLGLLFLITLIGFASFTPEESLREQNFTWLQQHQEAGKTTVLLNNQTGFLPLKEINQSIASVNMGVAFASVFDSLLNKYTTVTRFPAVAHTTDSVLNNLSKELSLYQTILVQVPASALQQARTIRFLQNLQKNKQVVLAVFGKQGFLPLADVLTVPIIWSEQETAAAADFAAQLVFGGISAEGQLSQTYSPKYKQGDGSKTTAVRLKYTVPEEVGIRRADLEQPIDVIVAEAIREQATPGAVVMVVKDGKVIFHKAYGAHTYDNTRPTKITDIFDLASITKTSATTIAAMRLYDQQKLSLDSTLGTYIPASQNTTKANLVLKDILLHQAGLPAGVFFPLRPQDVNRVQSTSYPVQAADSLFMSKNYFKEVMWPRLLNANTVSPGRYIYSDLTMYFIKEVVERQAMQSLDTYVQQNFYQPLGMQTAGFLPLTRFEKTRIVPTEHDTHFRRTLLQGYVHDGGAARLGGIAGHAGLYSTANDLAILYQMMLNRGTYGGTAYFRPATVDLFTSKQSKVSRRGLGFDRWDPDTAQKYPSAFASPATYGHTGYTGTCVWVDPARNLVYIFLSNRVYPKVTDKLSSLRIRPRIQDAIYKAIAKRTQITPVKQTKRSS